MRLFEVNFQIKVKIWAQNLWDILLYLQLVWIDREIPWISCMNKTEFRIELINRPFLLQIYSPIDPMLLMFYPDKLAIHKPNSIQLKAQAVIRSIPSRVKFLLFPIVNMLFIILIFLRKTCYSNANFIYVKSVGHNLKISNCHHICIYFYLQIIFHVKSEIRLWATSLWNFTCATQIH